MLRFFSNECKYKTYRGDISLRWLQCLSWEKLELENWSEDEMISLHIVTYCYKHSVSAMSHSSTEVEHKTLICLLFIKDALCSAIHFKTHSISAKICLDNGVQARKYVIKASPGFTPVSRPRV